MSNAKDYGSIDAMVLKMGSNGNVMKKQDTDPK